MSGDGRVSNLDLDGVELVVISRSRATPKLSVLSEAEREVCALVMSGHSNQVIATNRRTSVHTVSNQLKSIYSKLRVENRRELVKHLVFESS